MKIKKLKNNLLMIGDKFKFSNQIVLFQLMGPQMSNSSIGLTANYARIWPFAGVGSKMPTQTIFAFGPIVATWPMAKNLQLEREKLMYLKK